MQIKIIVQINKDTGQKNVCFTQDFDAPIDDFLIGGWENYDLMTGIVLLLSLQGDIMIESILDTELKSDDPGDKVSINNEAATKLRMLLEERNGNTQ